MIKDAKVEIQPTPSSVKRRIQCPECGQRLPVDEVTECDECGAHLRLKWKVEAPGLEAKPEDAPEGFETTTVP